MRKIFFECRSMVRVRFTKSALATLPRKLGLFTTVQYIGQIASIKKQLESAGIRVKLFRAATYPGQILGCTTAVFRGVDGFLFIGDGAFHPLALALNNPQPIFIYGPGSKKLSLLDRSTAVRWQKKRALALYRFSEAENIGILVSTKPGQCRMEEALALKKRLKANSYILLADDLDLAGLANFPFIDCFVNTACPRIGFDESGRIPKPVVNYEDVVRSRGSRASRHRTVSA
jgi:2-(3-amino-3-carboxypropyl)histidine synthase